jgi:sporulation protein YlmC with PRC-barrel domain
VGDKQSESRLVKLSRTPMAIDDPRDDVRGRHVVTVDGEKVGMVDDLLIDKNEQQVRFLEVGSGGFLGIGEHKSLIPIDAITSVDERHVYIDRSRDHVAAAPAYHPHVVPTDMYLYEVYEHYGYPAPWVPGAETL